MPKFCLTRRQTKVVIAYTSEVAREAGVHPNTVRLYETWGFLPSIPRSAAGYRLFTHRHVDQMLLARLALQGSYPGGKDPMLALVYASAADDLSGALEHAYRYLTQIRGEHAQAEAAALLLERWAGGAPVDATSTPLRIGQVTSRLAIAPDTLRNWERNRLLSVPRDPANGYRLYSATEIGRLRVIRMLRASGYSVMAVLRLMSHLDGGESVNLRQVLDTPADDEEIQSAADQWISTLNAQEERALAIIDLLEAMILKYG